MRRIILFATPLLLGALLWGTHYYLNGSSGSSLPPELVGQASDRGGPAALALVGELPASAPADLAQARALATMSELATARAALEGLAEREPVQGEVYVLLCEICRKQGDAESAMEYGARGVEALPASSHARHVHARALGQSMKTGGALAVVRALPGFRSGLETALELDPENVDARADEILYYVVSPALVRDLDRAGELALELEAIDPAQGALYRATVLATGGQRAQAIELLRRSIERFGEDQELRLCLARLHLASGEWAAAQEQFEAILTGPPSDPWHQASFYRARHRVQAGESPEQALEALEVYAREAPRGGTMPPPVAALFYSASALEQLGREGEAQLRREQALALDEDIEDKLPMLDVF